MTSQGSPRQALADVSPRGAGPSNAAQAKRSQHVLLGGRSFAKRLAIALWLALTLVTWNVVFDRRVWTAAEQFTRDNVERHQRGEAVPTINQAYRPKIRIAAREASLWAGGVFAIGGVMLLVAGRSARRHVDL